MFACPACGGPCSVQEKTEYTFLIRRDGRLIIVFRCENCWVQRQPFRAKESNEKHDPRDAKRRELPTARNMIPTYGTITFVQSIASIPVGAVQYFRFGDDLPRPQMRECKILARERAEPPCEHMWKYRVKIIDYDRK